MVPLTLAATTINPNILPHVCFMNIILPIRAMAYYVLGKTMMLQFRFTNKQFGFHYVIVILCLWMFFSFRYHTSFQESSGIIGIVQIITTVSVCLAILQIALTIKQKCKRSYLILCKLGKNTMPIYCLHYLAFMFCSIHIVNFYYPENKDMLRGNIILFHVSWWIYSIGGILLPCLLSYGLNMLKKRSWKHV